MFFGGNKKELSQIGFEKLSLKILKSLDFIDFFSIYLTLSTLVYHLVYQG